MRMRPSASAYTYSARSKRRMQSASAFRHGLRSIMRRQEPNADTIVNASGKEGRELFAVVAARDLIQCELANYLRRACIRA